MNLTRRTFGLGTMAIGLVGFGSAVAGPEVPSGARLEAALNACLARNPARAVFTVTEFETVTDGRRGTVHMRAAVRLDWQPGMRHRTFRVSGDHPVAAFATLQRSAAGVFGPVVPGFAAPAEIL
jgi:hypothetical protein